MDLIILVHVLRTNNRLVIQALVKSRVHPMPNLDSLCPEQAGPRVVFDRLLSTDFFWSMATLIDVCAMVP